MHAWQKQVQVTGRDIEKNCYFFPCLFNTHEYEDQNNFTTEMTDVLFQLEHLIFIIEFHT